MWHQQKQGRQPRSFWMVGDKTQKKMAENKFIEFLHRGDKQSYFLGLYLVGVMGTMFH